nr:MAG TPA: hypothetical protein [Caudoviricetes sp.]
MRTINIPLSQHIRHTGVLVASDNVDRLIVPLLTICKESDIIKMSRACFDIIELHIFIQAQRYFTSYCGCYTARKTCYHH